ncbi:MAG: L,D-transpeptidase/peptidoglycan binding protein [Agathobacter sp.]|nr:L,D-transpeptidase/peptidoglycan binding protein [Agathobacter sp.]
MTKNNKIFIVVAIIIASLVAVYLGLSFYFTTHFYFRSSVNGVDVSGKSITSAKETIQKTMDEYELVIIERDGTKESIVGNEIALECRWDNEIDTFLATQNGFGWILKVFKPDIHSSPMQVSFDDEKLQVRMQNLSCMDAKKQIAPESAAISEYSEKDGYKLVPSVAGSQINYTAFQSSINQAIYNMKTELNLDEAGCYVLPEITDDNEKLLAAISQLNKSLETMITYQVGESTQILDKSVFQPWFIVDDQMNVSIDEAQLSAYVKELSSTYNTCYGAKKLMTSYGVEVTIPNSHYGWKVNTVAEKEAILASILAGEQITRDLNYSMTANSHEGNDYGNSYVEINLTAQHLFMYVNGVLVVETDFVSGNLAKAYNTPTGAYGLTYKERNATLNGEDYSTPVSYWMPFAGNVGMHDATWRGSFGGSIYKRNGSHGCVNLPLSAAKTIFENISNNFPVLVYELAGTESPKGIAQDQAYVVIDLINAIGPVGLHSEPAIQWARANYDALSDAAKSYVTNYQLLLDSEYVLAVLKAQAGIQ